MSGPRWLGLDVGGANLKAAIASVEPRWQQPPEAVQSRAFPVWKSPERLGAELKRLIELMPAADGLAVTMTAELCDCYATKAEGVRSILEAVSSAWGARPEPIRVWGVDGTFHDVEETRRTPSLAAASNWLATALVAARLALPGTGAGLLGDVGSTTTDLTAIRDGQPLVAEARTDADRLRQGSLVYAGVRRTPVCALATVVDWNGGPTGLAAELFATTLDVYLALGRLRDRPDDTDTADGRAATATAARDRLARMVGADRETFTEADAQSLAEVLHRGLLDRLASAAGRVLGGERPQTVVVAGSGGFLGRELASKLGAERVIDLASLWGEAGSGSACAVAVSRLAGEAVTG